MLSNIAMTPFSGMINRLEILLNMSSPSSNFLPRRSVYAGERRTCSFTGYVWGWGGGGPVWRIEDKQKETQTFFFLDGQNQMENFGVSCLP
jgi:hypothetical protein